MEFNSKFLVKLCHLLAKVAAACMDNKVFCTVCCLVYLNKMVAPAKRPKASLKVFCIFKASVAAKFHKVKMFLPAFPYIHSRRDIMRCFICLFKVNVCLANINCIHATANIHTNNIWHCLSCYCHCSAYCTAFPRMYIGHNPYAASFCKFIITHTAYLFPGFFFYGICITYCSINFSFNLKHNNPPVSASKTCGTVYSLFPATIHFFPFFFIYGRVKCFICIYTGGYFFYVFPVSCSKPCKRCCTSSSTFTA